MRNRACIGSRRDLRQRVQTGAPHMEVMDEDFNFRRPARPSPGVRWAVRDVAEVGAEAP
ncbi:hypothetical protein GCM10011609_15720 [Lentzea pudingi]|uniref:Uncharacterized protein n=1 Tax=Lentzea pudingi TaxID=1789439 RepID=A0ABQ2HHS4_9PSEU|nr:hypothetical protein GCM10011609_15720 [Lentzea pudingi]